MSKRAQEAALTAYPVHIIEHQKVMGGVIKIDTNTNPRFFFTEGYEQAEKDTIAKVRKQVEMWMPDDPEGDEYTSGKRVAFRSVLLLLKEMEEEL